jgi:hypothetical protein
MAIAGIGRTGAPGASEADPAGSARAGTERFELPAEEDVRSERSAPLARGEADVAGLDAYLESHVERAVAHLQSTLTSEQLALLKEALSDQIRSDPVLLELAQRATGQLSRTSNGGG